MREKLKTVVVSSVVYVVLAPLIAFGASFFFVNDAGDVGIGNSNPQAKLDVSGSMYSRLVTDTDAASVTVDWSDGNIHSITLNRSDTGLTFSGGQAGGEYRLILNQDTTGNRDVEWPTSVAWPGGTPPVLSTGASSTDVATFLFDGSVYLGFLVKNYSTNPTTVAVLVVAGGGSAADGYGGGGGAGGVIYNSAFPVTATSYSVTVGAGGSAPASSAHGNNGENSVFSSLTAVGGGGGGTYYAVQTGNSGGSGGGGSDGQAGGSGTSGQGNSGGTGAAGAVGGGGGGAGSVGASGASGGAGGSGVSNSISGASVTYGVGGGGTGSSAGTANRGNGGSANAGAGGSGVVIISYPTGSLTATGGTVTTSGGNTVHTFTSSGTFTITSI